MPTFSLLAKGVIPTGIQTFGPVIIPDGITQVILEIDHGGLSMPGLAWGLMVSLDGGLTWAPYGAVGTAGPQNRLTSFFGTNLPAGSGRQIQAFLWVSSPALLGLRATIL